MALTVLLRAKMFLPALAACIIATAVSFIGGSTAISMDFATGRPDLAQRIPFSQIAAVATSIATAWLLRPRFWEWERLGSYRVRWYSASAALIGLILPLLPAAIGLLRVPEDADPWLVLPMTLFFSAVTFMLSPLVGAMIGGLLSMTALFAGAVVLNLQPALGHVLPVTYATGQGFQHPQLPGWWAAAPLLAVLAAVVHAFTAGATNRSWSVLRE
jgi:hypothetical protein